MPTSRGRHPRPRAPHFLPVLISQPLAPSTAIITLRRCLLPSRRLESIMAFLEQRLAIDEQQQQQQSPAKQASKIGKALPAVQRAALPAQ